ncbi:protein mono-ADP-ribosyltransferase PARP12-like [Homarus americanus]|uniref:protein mono-ADP-ribosyltransferase PARP12-like n=1 Tax=Homarus americanus TaxID=6706 RepID=UPI001C49133B|nr:protein mono-ADP-ribosyltransferase PARP12-like [Homarus americanus]
MFNMMKRCTRDPCTQVHSTMPYLWEINYNENFLRLSYEQSDHLERLFCHPAQDKAEFPPLPSNVRHHSRYEQLRNVLSSSESWQVDMETMKISSGSSSIVIRRLSTPSDITYDLRVASRWIWYWCDDNGSWKPYTHGDNNKYFVVALSDHLEYHMHFSNEFHFFVKVGGQHYDIDTREMTQKNIITGKIRKIRRRPACTVLEDKETSFDRMFTKLPKDKKYLLTPVLPQTSEYIFIEKMMSESLSNLSCEPNNTYPTVSSINRMQNDHLWKTYQNKKRQLLCFYSNDLSKVNEQYLFHGTKHSVIDLICSENLDWRLFGRNVGNAYGQGTYFANNAKLGFPTIDKEITEIVKLAKEIGGEGCDDMQKEDVNELLDLHFQEPTNEELIAVNSKSDDDDAEVELIKPKLTMKATSEFLLKANELCEICFDIDSIMERSVKFKRGLDLCVAYRDILTDLHRKSKQ